MSYAFTFDLSKISQAFFKEISDFSEKSVFQGKIKDMAKNLLNKFNVDKITGLAIRDSLIIIEDLIDANIINNLNRKRFEKTEKRVLFLPHCCRKYMDSRCKADFDVDTASYICSGCSDDCQVNEAASFAKKENYDVYVVPGSSCVKKICRKYSYDGVVGVACTEEIGLAVNMFKKSNIPMQSIPLIKNGCAGTVFDYKTFQDTIKRNDE